MLNRLLYTIHIPQEVNKRNTEDAEHDVYLEDSNIHTATRTHTQHKEGLNACSNNNTTHTHIHTNTSHTWLIALHTA